jgi:O-antigen/teichoic acid export membrane protein
LENNKEDFSTKIRSFKIIKKNILGLSLLRLMSLLLGFFMVPLTLSYLDTSKYGIWLTLSSIIGWFGLMDIGLGNSLRNKLGEAWAIGNNKLARTFVSTTYALLIGIVLIANIIFWIINPFLDWAQILNIENDMLAEINPLVIIVFSFFTFRMVFNLISPILAADQRPALSNLILFIASLLSFGIIYILTLTTKNSLIYLGSSLSILSALVPLIASIWFFKNEYHLISPSVKFIDFSKIKALAGQGVQFFILQIASLILSMTDMIIIVQLYGPEEVVPYNIAFRLFNYVIVLFAILTTPFWAAYNEAYNQRDFGWITRVTNKLIMVCGLVTLGVLLLIGISGYIYQLWIGDKVIVPNSLSMFMGIFVIIQLINSIFATFIFATGKLRVLTIMAVFVGLINIPLCIIFAETLGFGTSGIIMSTAVCALFNLIAGAIQYYKIIKNQDRGIWSK